MLFILTPLEYQNVNTRPTAQFLSRNLVSKITINEFIALQGHRCTILPMTLPAWMDQEASHSAMLMMITATAETAVMSLALLHVLMVSCSQRIIRNVRHIGSC